MARLSDPWVRMVDKIIGEAVVSDWLVGWVAAYWLYQT